MNSKSFNPEEFVPMAHPGNHSHVFVLARFQSAIMKKEPWQYIYGRKHMHQRLSLMFGATKEIETEALFGATKDIESEQLIYSPNNGNIGRIELQLNLLLPCKNISFQDSPHLWETCYKTLLSCPSPGSIPAKLIQEVSNQLLIVVYYALLVLCHTNSNYPMCD